MAHISRFYHGCHDKEDDDKCAACQKTISKYCSFHIRCCFEFMQMKGSGVENLSYQSMNFGERWLKMRVLYESMSLSNEVEVLRLLDGSRPAPYIQFQENIRSVGFHRADRYK